MHPSEIIKGIDFDAVGSTNLKTLDFSDAILKEKLSFMIFAEYYVKKKLCQIWTTANFIILLRYLVKMATAGRESFLS